MRIGIPKEIKPLEGRVGLIPAACGGLVQAGHQVLVEAGAGRLSGFADEDYRAVGAEVVADADTLYAQAELIVKVKEPIGPELERLRERHLLFSYLHLAAAPELTQRLCEIGLTAVAFETVTEGGRLPLLAPMSDIAGRLAVQIGAHLLHAPQGGKGKLLGGLPAADRGHVVIVGGGVAGSSAAIMAAGMGARVTVFDRQRDKLERLRALSPAVTGLYPYPAELAQAVAGADLLIGAVYLVGQKAPHVVSREMIAAMAPGGVLVDIAVDQGGCFETTRPTDYRAPTYVELEQVHFAVTNMPGAVPRSASEALSASLMPYVLRLAGENWRDDPALRSGINVEAGRVVHPALRAEQG